MANANLVLHSQMDQISRDDEIAFEMPPLFRIYKNGRIDRLVGEDTIPPFTDPQTGIQSKDIILSPQSGLSARLFMPRLTDPTGKLPLLVYIHGGGFCLQSPFSSQYHSHVAALTAGGNAVALSVHYRRAPEHPLPIAYDDVWEALQWAAAHSGGNGPEPWLNDHADLGRVFVVGDSAGATLGHYSVRRAGVDGLSGIRIVGLIVVHPFFSNDEPEPNNFLDVIFPTRSGSGDPRLNPGKDPELGRLGCEKVLVFVGEKDILKGRGWAYYEAIKKSEWSGEVGIVECEGEGHVFHLFDPSCDRAVALMNKVISFLKEE
ncbi:hypothetical protein TIFTF001_006924 [Ficus carica]|uniref:Alpha/beta hydrolase fold-3 domain-containing protein n=1 Tax=Ficus carica TaxID=3494 RepID=A0AA88CZ59_FICCA|nr:hypothetical protein TIFTF001_006924 [Ficus carica]